MIYYENIVKILWTWQLFFLLFHRVHNFPPIFDNAFVIIVKKKKLYPYFDNGIATIFPCHFGHSTHGQQNWAEEIQYHHCRNSTFSLSTFFFFSLILLVEFLSYFWLNFGNSNTEIQSLSSKSQISLNSSYNVNYLQILQYQPKRLWQKVMEIFVDSFIFFSFFSP